MVKRQATAKKPRADLTEQQAMQLAVATTTSLAAVYRWARGDEVRQTTLVRLTRAANELGLKGAST